MDNVYIILVVRRGPDTSGTEGVTGVHLTEDVSEGLEVRVSERRLRTL